MKQQRKNPLSELIVGCAFAYGAWYTQGWVYDEWALMPYLFGFFAAWLFLSFTISILFFVIPQIWRYIRIMKTKGRVGTASWSSPRELRKNKHFKRLGFFVGAHSKRGVFIDIESAGLVLSPAGGGKTVNFVIPALCHNSDSMIVPDLKATLACMTGDLRKKQFKHEIICVNPAGLYSKILGKGARYNPLIILTEN